MSRHRLLPALLVLLTLAILPAIAASAGGEDSARNPERLAALLADLDGAAPDSAQQQRLREAVDAEAAQRYAWASRLFWHTDLAAAQAEAREANKPILSLRMLGRLTDELSCANSRFFRTALYANADVSRTLRERFVLHWASERPVPVLTIDFGDGRVVRRTVTGNSIHYLLGADGAILDALPGLAGPQAFGQWLERSHQLHTALQQQPSEQRRTISKFVLRNWLREDQRAWEVHVASLGRSHLAPPEPAGGAQAERAVTRARSKSVVEIPLIPALTLSGEPVQELESPEVWNQLAELHLDQCRLDEGSLALIRWQRPLAAADGDAAWNAMRKKFEHNMAVDTVRNRYVLQRQLRLWLINAEQPLQLEDLNRRVYAELFQTPREDRWLGLMPADAYSGLVDGGIVGILGNGATVGQSVGSVSASPQQASPQQASLNARP